MYFSKFRRLLPITGGFYIDKGTPEFYFRDKGE